MRTSVVHVTLWLVVLLGVRTCRAFTFLDKILRQNVSTHWNEDLEPELEKFAKLVRKQVFPIANEIMYDDAINAECLKSFARIMSGARDYKLWAFKCECLHRRFERFCNCTL